MNLKEILSSEGVSRTYTLTYDGEHTSIMVPTELMSALRRYAAFHGKSVGGIVNAINGARPEEINLSKAVRMVARVMRGDITDEIEF